MSPDPLDLAYLAGVIDSDGYITITRSVRKGVAYHAAQVGIAGTRRQPHDLAASIWGGNVGCFTPKNPEHRPQFQWVRHGVNAVQVISDLQPFLRIKQAQAQIALELQEHLDFGRCEDPFPWFGPDYDPRAARDVLRLEIIGLNQSRNRLRSGRALFDPERAA
jgi:hypothetical protein